MPRQGVGETEAQQLVAFLRWVDGIENHDWPPQDSPRRWKRSTERLLTSSTIADYIADPQAVAAASEMPAFPNLAPAQRGAIAAFLVSAATEAGR